MKSEKRMLLALLCCVFFGAVLLALVVLPSNLALASTADTQYDFYFENLASQQGTEVRNKETSSKVFLAVQYKDRSLTTVNFYIDGARTSNGYLQNRTRNYVAPAYHTGYFTISNNVYESGDRWARLTAMSGGGYGRVAGYWSPDTNEPWRPTLN